MAEIDVAVVILYDGPRMLVSLRPEGSFYAGWWEWPGGKVEKGESAEECARRELFEEIGFQVGALTRFVQTVAEYPGRSVRMTFFIGSRPAGQQAGNDALEHRWLLPQEVKALRFLEPNLPVLERLMKHPPLLPE